MPKAFDAAPRPFHPCEGVARYPFDGWYEKLRVVCGALVVGICMLECSSAGAAGAPDVQQGAACVQHELPQAAWAAVVAPNKTLINENAMDFNMVTLL